MDELKQLRSEIEELKILIHALRAEVASLAARPITIYVNPPTQAQQQIPLYPNPTWATVGGVYQDIDSRPPDHIG